MRVVGIVAAAVAVVAFITMMTVVIDRGTPNSTQGVSVIGANLARVPQGETAVVTRMVAKSSQTWRITPQGNQVVATCNGLCGDPAPATLCGINCEVRIRTGDGLSFRLQLREDGAVNVAWPDSWTYRPYRP